MLDFRNLYNYYCRSIYCEKCDKYYNKNYYNNKHIKTQKHIKNL